jgi:hypothetical protein
LRCVFHDPESAARTAAGRKAGGKASRKPAVVLPPGTPDVALSSVPEVVAFLTATANRVQRGELDAKVANCLVYLSATVLRAIQPDEAARQVEELRREIEDLRRGQRVPEAGVDGAAARTGPAAGGRAGEPGAGAAAGRPGADHGRRGAGAGPVAEDAPYLDLLADAAPLLSAGG